MTALGIGCGQLGIWLGCGRPALGVIRSVGPPGLGAGIYSVTMTLTAAGRSDIPAVTLPVSLIVGNLAVLFPQHLYLPTLARR